MKFSWLLVPAIIIAVLAGCSSGTINIGPKREAVSHNYETIKVDKPVELYLKSDSGNIEVYSWQNSEVKFEIAKVVRDIYSQDVLQEKLKDFCIVTNHDGGRVSLDSKYRGNIKNPADRRADIKVYIPRKVKLIDCALDIGTVKFYDDVNAELSIKVNMANVEINKFEGLIKFRADMGDLKISGGRLMSKSDVVTNMGNIRIKAGYQAGGTFNYKTGMGNIELAIPQDSDILVDTIKGADSKDYNSDNSQGVIKAHSAMGRITVDRY